MSNLLNKEVELPCGSTIRIAQLRTTSQANQSESEPNWFPYVDLLYIGEIWPKDKYGYDIEIDDCASVSIPIQLRSLNSLIELLTEIRDELKK